MIFWHFGLRFQPTNIKFTKGANEKLIIDSLNVTKADKEDLEYKACLVDSKTVLLYGEFLSDIRLVLCCLGYSAFINLRYCISVSDLGFVFYNRIELDNFKSIFPYVIEAMKYYDKERLFASLDFCEDSVYWSLNRINVLKFLKSFYFDKSFSENYIDVPVSISAILPKRLGSVAVDINGLGQGIKTKTKPADSFLKSTLKDFDYEF